MKFYLPIAIIASAVCVEANWKVTPGHTWDYLLGAEKSVISASTKDVVTIDLEKAKEFAPYFHNRGQRVVCYFSGGTTETREYDKAEYQKANIALSGNGDGWGNQWLDIKNKKKLQPLIRNRMVRARDAGCDAVEVDCIGIYHYRDDYTEDDSYVFAKWVAETAHEVGISIGLKNVASIAPKLEKYFDFAVVESCAESPNVCKYYTSFTDNNKAVFIVHYGNRGHKLSGSSLSNLIKEQGGHRFTCVLSDHQNLHHSSTNYDCDTGEVISSSGSKEKESKEKESKEKETTTTTIKKTTTTTIKKTTTTTIKKTTTTTTSETTTTTTTTSETTTTTTTTDDVPSTTEVATTEVAATDDVTTTTDISATDDVTSTTDISATDSPTSEIKKFIPDKTNDAVKSIDQVDQAATIIPATSAQDKDTTQPLNNKKETAKKTDKTASKEAGGSVSNPDDKDEINSGVGATVAIVAAGGVATAAVAGFLFLKKNKRYDTDGLVY